jgi:hypothetical protein
VAELKRDPHAPFVAAVGDFFRITPGTRYNKSITGTQELKTRVKNLWTRTEMETIKRILEVDRQEINYLRVTIESYDGMGVVKTIDRHAALIEVRVSPGYEQLFSELTRSLEQNEGISLVDKTGSI